VDADQAWWVGSGLRIDYAGPDTAEPVAVIGPDGTFVAMAENENGHAKYLAVFAPNRGPAKS
jgi:tRNA pseudouridine55 synthase